MILVKFKEEPISDERIHNSALRYVFDIGLWHIGFVQQGKVRKTGQWYDLTTGYYEIWITKNFAFGSQHGWYDGPHCCFSIGWLHFTWSPDGCKKCEGMM